MPRTTPGAAHRTRGVTLVAASLLVLTAVEVSRAANCGGDKVCACGDKITQDYNLTADLGPCRDGGLRIGAAITFDGGGHTIRGPGPGTEGAGLRIGEDGSGARVQNLAVTGFEHGIRLVGARNVRLTDVEAYGNGDPGPREGYGIDVSSASSDNVLERVKVHDNADEGIHVGTDAARNRIVDAQVRDNSRENVYFLACHDNRLERSTLSGSGSGNASIYVKFASGTVVEDTTVSGGPIQIRGGSRDTRLIGNRLRDAAVILEEQDDKRFGRGRPSGTELRGGSIDSSGACVRIESASGTRIEDVSLTCPDGVRVGRGNRVAVRLPTTGTGKGRLPVRCAGGSDCVDDLGGASR